MRDRYVLITAVSGLVLIGMGYLLLSGQLTDLNIEAQRLLNEIGLGDLYDL
jgi:cytochrome c-type biogenesis protein